MSDKVRELYVTLSLNATDFDKHIRAANKQIKEAESEFKKAAAGSERFEKTLHGMAERAKSLKKQLGAAEEIVSQYGSKVKSLTERLDDEISKSSQLDKQLEEEVKERNRLRTAIEQQEEAVRTLEAAYGSDDGRTAHARQELAEYAAQLKASEESVKRAGKAAEENRNQIYKTGNALKDVKTALNNAEAELMELTIELNKNENAWYTHGVAMQEWAGQALKASKSVERAGDTLTKKVTVPLLGLGAAAGKAAIDYESAFAGVRKTVNATGEDAEAFFDGLSDSAIEMSKTLATSAEDVTEVMAIAGQLGIANDELTSFTDTIVRMGMSTDLAGEDAAASMARFANITGMAQSKFQNLGATLVYLGNNFATTESEIMAMAVRIAAAGAQVGLSESQILGFAAALSSLGLEAEAGGSAFSTALKKMETAVATNSKALGDFAKVAGLTREQFAAMWTENPAEAFEAFITGLSKMDEEGMSAIAVLDEIGITQLRLSDTLLRTANATEMLRNAQSGANQAWADGRALIEESDVRLQTTASRLTNVKNSLIAAGISFGETMAPEIERLVGLLENAVEWFGNLDESTRRNIVNWGMFAAAAGPAIKAVGKVGTAFAGTVNLIGQFSKAIGTAQATMKATGSTASLLGTMLGPGGKFMVGLGAGAAALAALIALYNKVEAEKPDLSIDTSEIENLSVDIDDIKANAKVDMKIELKEGIKSARDQIVGILNDGLPEGEEEQKTMSQAVQTAIGNAYKGIEEKLASEQEALDNLLQAGVIDKATYDQSLTELQTQAETMKTELDTSSKAVTDYVTLMVAQNRAMTEEEIAELDRLLAALHLTAQEVELAADAQMQVYEAAYKKTRLGIGDETDRQHAVEYIELIADEKLQELKAREEAARQLYGQQIAQAEDEEEVIRLTEEETEALNKLEEARKAVYGEKMGMQGEILPGILQSAGIKTEELEAYLAALERLEKFGIDPTDGISAGEWMAQQLLVMDDMDGDLTKIEAFARRMEESGLFGEDGIIAKMLATNAEQGAINPDVLSTTEGVLKTVATLATALNTDLPKVNQTAEITAEEFYGPIQQIQHTAETLDGTGIGNNLMNPIKEEIENATPTVEATVRGAMSRIVAVAKDTLGIHSPSRVFRDEIGKMLFKGVEEGMTDELPNLEKLTANAMGHITYRAKASTGAGGMSGGKTYNSESSVMVTGNTFVVNDRQDIQSLATEIATLTRSQQRGRGAKMA